jgi:hypothetical protein
VTAGGLSLDGQRFYHCDATFLFPVSAMASVFRAKVLNALWDAQRAAAFEGYRDFEDPEGFERLINRLPKKWNVYAKPSFDQGKHVLQYLGRYTHRVGMANSRLLQVTADTVTFRTRGADTATTAPVEFLRRFVRHVLPDGFHKIRHVGLNASESKREAARAALRQTTRRSRAVSWQERLRQVTDRDVCRCPSCKAPLLSTAFASPLARAPPARLEKAA